MKQGSHIAPPNWHTLCGIQAAPGVDAYDFCSLPAADEELLDPTKWCQSCVKAALQDAQPQDAQPQDYEGLFHG